MSTTKIRYSVALPDGTTATRTSARTYTHAIVVHDERGWGVIGFAGSMSLAMKGVAKYQGWRYYGTQTPCFDDVRVLAVDQAVA